MARRLRIEYPGAMHHVINRGNYRRDLFENVGAAEAFLRTLHEAAGKFGWKLHAYVLMRNHFHLAVETPEPTLGEGMHWLQSSRPTSLHFCQVPKALLTRATRQRHWLRLPSSYRSKTQK